MNIVLYQGTINHAYVLLGSQTVTLKICHRRQQVFQNSNSISSPCFFFPSILSRREAISCSQNNLLKETELKAALNWSTRRAKGSPLKKAPRLKKEKSLTLGSKLAVVELAVVEGGGVDADEVAYEWEPGVPITSPCDSVTVSDL